MRDENLLRLLYALSELSGKPAYRDAAEAELRWLLRNSAARGATLAPWDEGLAWDVVADKLVPTAGKENRTSAAARPWVLWDHCFELEPETSLRLAQGLLERVPDGATDPRRAAYNVRAFAVAYQRTKDQTLLKSIEAELARLEAAGRQAGGDEHAGSATASLSAAIDCDGAATRVPEPLAGRLRDFARECDRAFCLLPHDLKAKRGFISAWTRKNGDTPAATYTPLWHAATDPGPGKGATTAAVAMMCLSRYENTGNIAYRDLIHLAADAYGNDAALPDDASPRCFGHAISVQLAAWRSTARQAYLDRARQLANVAVERFWGTQPLPASATTSPNYDTAT